MKKPLLLPDDAMFVKNLKYSYTPAKDIANYCKENHNIFTSEFAAQIEKRLMRAFVIGFKEAKPKTKPEPKYIVQTPKAWWENKSIPEYFAYSDKIGMGTTTISHNKMAQFSKDDFEKFGLKYFVACNECKESVIK